MTVREDLVRWCGRCGHPEDAHATEETRPRDTLWGAPACDICFRGIEDTGRDDWYLHLAPAAHFFEPEGERAAATPDGPRYTGPICSYCGCSPGEDCDVHECLAHPSAVCRECDGAVDEECWRLNDGVKCEIGIHDPRCNDYHPFAPTGEPEQVPDLDASRKALIAAIHPMKVGQTFISGTVIATQMVLEFERAIRAESEAQHEATKAYLAETAVAIEARASAAEEQVRVLTEALERIDRLAEPPEFLYRIDHEAIRRIARAALRASISTDTKNEEE